MNFPVRVMSVALVLAVIGAFGAYVEAPSFAATTQPTSCNSGVRPYSEVIFEILNCGYSITQLESTQSTSDGGTSYTYPLSGGGTISFEVPPSTFDPMTASLSELSLYGIPARPSLADSGQFAAWSEDYANVNFTAPPSTLLNAPISNLSTTSLNWAGAIATSSSKSTYTMSNATFTQPSNAVSHCMVGGPVSLGSIWTGLGGESMTSTLAQDGTFFGSTNGLNGEFWYEFVPGSTTLLPKYASPGDTVESSVTYDSGSLYSMNIFDMTSGVYYSMIVSEPAGFTPDGTIAEAIVERPLINNSYFANLPFFGTVNFSDSEAQSGGVIHYLSYYPHQSQTMVASNGDTLADMIPGLIGPVGQFPENYVACS
jgi:hypothetical protein